MKTDLLRALAEHGARTRIAQINEERAAITRLFPHLTNVTPVRRPSEPHRVSEPDPTADAEYWRKRNALKPRGRRTVSAAERANISKRMKAYWRKRRAAKANGDV